MYCCHVQLLSHVRLFAVPRTVAFQAPLSMGFSRQVYWSGLPRPALGDLPNPGIKPASLRSPALAGRFFATSVTREAFIYINQFTSVTQSCPTLCDPMDSLSTTNSQSLLRLTSIESMKPSNHLILFCPLSPPTFNLSQHQVFSNESVLCIRWPKYWSFSFSISPSDEYSGLISFRMDWLDLLAVQGTLKSLLLHHSSKAHIYTRDLLLCKSESHSVVSDSLRSHGLYNPWNSPGQNAGMRSLSLLQRIFPTQRSNPGLPHCRGRFFTS